MAIPSWDDLTPAQRRSLQNLASSFGINVEGERVDDMVLPNEKEAYSIALEMFMLSRSIIEKHGG